MRHLSIIGVLFAAVACATNPATRPDASTSSGSSGAPGTAASMAAPAQGIFTLVHGADTVAAERFTRSADRLQVDFGAQGITLFRYDAALTPEATVSHMQVTTTVPGSPARIASATFQGDTAILAGSAGADSAKTLRTAVPQGTLPYINPSASLMEQIVRRARIVGGKQVTVPVLVASTGGQTTTATVSFPSPDSAHIQLAGVTVLLRVDSAGTIMSGSVPVQGITIARSDVSAGAP